MNKTNVDTYYIAVQHKFNRLMLTSLTTGYGDYPRYTNISAYNSTQSPLLFWPGGSLSYLKMISNIESLLGEYYYIQ